MIDEHPHYPKTIIFSEDINDAIDQARMILEEQEAVSLKFQQRVDYDKLFKDPEFLCSKESIY